MKRRRGQEQQRPDPKTNLRGNIYVFFICFVVLAHRGAILIWIAVGQGPAVLLLGAGQCSDIFFHHLCYK